MELDLQSLFGLHVCAHMHSLAKSETPATPSPPHLGSYTRALQVSQDRRHLFVTPWNKILERVACSDKIIVTVRMIGSCSYGLK